MNLAYLKSKASVLLKSPKINALRGVPMPHFTGEAAQTLVARKIEERTGCLIARVGATEARATAHYLRHRLALPLDRLPYGALGANMKSLSGYFPINDEAVDQYIRLHLSAIAEINVYAAWTPQDALLCPPQATRVRLIDLDPFFTQRKWTTALEGRRVCIVSPFVDTIRAQYLVRNKYFQIPVMPEMELTYVRAPMTQCESDITGQSWHENLSNLTDGMLSTDAEVVIIGAGAYGLPLGAVASRHGKTTVVLGGSTQLLFGIKGARWENDRQYRAIFNEHWVRPSESERPPGYQNNEIKGGAYW